MQEDKRGAFKRGKEPTMDLPEGKFCGDCANIHRCEAIYGRIPEDEVCDWSPSRFLEVQI
jgi:hypothetical protein